MIELLKKDWRNNRAAVVGGIVLLAMPYFVALVSLVSRWNSWTSPRDWAGAIGGTAIGELLCLATILSGVFGGMAFALERRERSMDFLLMLPVKRGRILFSKLIVIAACLVAVWLINLAVIGVYAFDWGRALPGGLTRVILPPLTLSMMSFGVAWLCSSFLESPAISASIGIGAAIASFAGITIVINDLGWSDVVGFHIVYAWTTFAGIITFLAGTIYWMRRVKP